MSLKHKLGIIFAAMFVICLFAVPITILYQTRDNGTVIDYEAQAASLAAAQAAYEAEKAEKDAASMAEAMAKMPTGEEIVKKHIQEKAAAASSAAEANENTIENSNVPAGQDTGNASKPEPPPPPELPEEQLTNPESKPEYTPEQIKPNEPPASSAAPEASKPSTPKTTTPKNGDQKTENGKTYTYLNGFGWLEGAGDGGTTGGVGVGSGDINKQVGQMG